MVQIWMHKVFVENKERKRRGWGMENIINGGGRGRSLI